MRTKHVHRLHPYLGKYIPQLVEELFRRHVPARGRVLDPFAGSGTTLVQALESGLHSVGVDIAAFNCLLMRVKTASTSRSSSSTSCATRSRASSGGGCAGERSAYVRAWFAPQARDDLLRFRSLIGDYEHADVLRIVLARAARSARRTTHFDLDFPKLPQAGPYWLQAQARVQADREGRPLHSSLHARHADAAEGIRACAHQARVEVLHGDAGELELPGPFDAVVTSPPYPGLIDYHEQHRYAYELLGLDDLREREIGAAERGTSKAAIDAYVDGIVGVLAACATC